MKTVEDRRAYQRAWAARNRERLRARARELYATDPERRAKFQVWRDANKESKRNYDREYRKRNKDKKRANSLKALGYTLELFRAQLAEQNHRCAICDCAFRTEGEAHADHCHASGQPRGLLCARCNTALGMFKDDPERLQRAIEYLRKPPLSLA